MIDLSTATRDEILRLNSEKAMMTLVNVVLSLSTDVTVRAALVNQRVTSVTFAGVAYDGANFTRPVIAQNSDGRLEPFEITFDTANPIAATMVHRLNGLHDAPIRVISATEAALSSLDDARYVDAAVISCVEHYGVATLTIGRPDRTNVGLPRDVFNPDGCPFKLGKLGCRFPFPRIGEIGYGDPNIMRCTQRYHGAGGCVAKGDNEVARILAGQLPEGARLHPANFGAQKALPAQR